MEKISLPVAEKLLLLRQGERIPASQLPQTVFKELQFENILYRIGKNRGYILLLNQEQLDLYLLNHYSIANLDEYVSVLKEEDTLRASLIKVSTDSKLIRSRSFKGFLVNCYDPVEVCLNGKQTLLNPTLGLFHFVYDFEHFIPDPQLTIVGVENPESFRYIEKQRYLFKDMKPLFISRYPQNQHGDVIRWLKAIPNPYLHFGDFDFAGINIYMNEFKRHLPNGRCSFFVPPGIEELFERYGNYERYDRQKLCVDMVDITESQVAELIGIIHRYRRGVDQEVLVRDV
ncbi:hypothetical protein [Bacteroides sp. 51]|uniref:DUF7281 domain-containing protein n=1 Tax=Bacteroides sp. 51 TaxID=2302938 RepID=UPI0013D46997|nr:hypothetical protein [Bacteroides sp. 51]NDV83648.1 hypothetical protein [Bacteroides sp. 51]